MKHYTPITTKHSTKYGANYWESYSMKVKRVVCFFSELEYKNWLCIETDSDIIDFCEQPLEISIEWNGKIRNSIFDMWVKYKDEKEEFWEVKYSSDLQEKSKKGDRAREQIEKQKQWCQNQGYIHRVRTEQEIELGVSHMNNLRYIVGCMKRVSPDILNSYTSYVESYLKSQPSQKCSIHNLLKKSAHLLRTFGNANRRTNWIW